MGWYFSSIKKTSNSQFRGLRLRLLLSYLAVTVAILGSSTITAYEFFAVSLYQQLDNQLLTVADAGVHGLEAIKEDHEDEDDDDDDDDEYQIEPRLDGDGDLDIPWQNFRQPRQGIEWFDENGQLLAREGNIFPPIPITTDVPTGGSGHTVEGGIRTLTLAAGEEELEGYVRVSQSAAEVKEVLAQLRWGMFLGGAIAASLSVVGGMWLSDRSLKPIEASFDRLKQFTADASHELRSPLTVIKTSVDVMLTHPERLHPADTKKFEGIASALKQMTRLVEDLLILARTDKSYKTSKVESVSIPLEEFLEDLVDLFSPQAETKEITLKCNLTNGVFVKGDTFLLKRLFSNLLENALNYTPTGGTVTISLQRQERFAVVCVEDTGIGIAPEHLPLVFDRLWRADKARSRHQGGSGLGLAIAKAITEQHRGQLSVTSELGVGTCFQVLLPLSPLSSPSLF
jgi:signal transduction histidine kinase